MSCWCRFSLSCRTHSHTVKYSTPHSELDIFNRVWVSGWLDFGPTPGTSASSWCGHRPPSGRPRWPPAPWLWGTPGAPPPWSAPTDSPPCRRPPRAPLPVRWLLLHQLPPEERNSSRRVRMVTCWPFRLSGKSSFDFPSFILVKA